MVIQNYTRSTRRRQITSDPYARLTQEGPKEALGAWEVSKWRPASVTFFLLLCFLMMRGNFMRGTTISERSSATVTGGQVASGNIIMLEMFSDYKYMWLLIQNCQMYSNSPTPRPPFPDRKPICQRIICLRKCMNVLVRLWIKVPPSVRPQTTASPPTSCPFNQGLTKVHFLWPWNMPQPGSWPVGEKVLHICLIWYTLID